MCQKVAKYIIIGNAGVGKTSILKRLKNDTFNENYTITIGVDYYSYNLNNMKLHIWDTAGLEDYNSINEVFYRNVDCVLYVFDTNNLESFLRIPYWINEVNKVNNNTIGFLIGNKTDKNNKNSINDNIVIELCKKYNLIYIKCSAKNGDNIKNIFDISSTHIEPFLKKTSNKIKIENKKICCTIM